jgi:long-chain acyl-CoA synthetase
VHVGGFNVFPGEVEAVLLAHPDVAEAAVVGVTHPVLGATLRAFVVPRDGTDPSPASIVRFMRAQVAGYKVPYAVEIRRELPALASGKPDRRALVRMGAV